VPPILAARRDDLVTHTTPQYDFSTPTLLLSAEFATIPELEAMPARELARNLKSEQ
jgi:hypothetical protein